MYKFKQEVIIKDSGAPKGSLYYYFLRGKEGLAVEAMKYIIENIMAYVTERNI